MKRLFILAIAALFVMMPLTSFAKVAISDGDLDAVTAEAGVSIDFTNVKVGGTTTLSSVSWGDPTGFTTGGFTNPGYFGFSNFVIGGNLLELSGTMKIDVGTSGSETKVQIVLPTTTIGGAAGANISAMVRAYTSADLSASAAQKGGTISLYGFSTQVTGTMTIYAHD
ncbi:MAG: hypothetical protein WC373_14765 [Smithella sp.]|jgi:hypothetical protein